MFHDPTVRAGMAGVCLMINYNGFRRKVEVHAVGLTRAGHKVARVWQVEGGSSSGVFTGWKLMRVDQMRELALTEQRSQAPRYGYRRGDRTMTRILWQI